MRCDVIVRLWPVWRMWSFVSLGPLSILPLFSVQPRTRFGLRYSTRWQADATNITLDESSDLVMRSVCSLSVELTPMTPRRFCVLLQRAGQLCSVCRFLSWVHQFSSVLFTVLTSRRRYVHWQWSPWRRHSPPLQCFKLATVRPNSASIQPKSVGWPTRVNSQRL